VLNAGAVLGSLVSVGDHTVVQSGTVLARGVQIADARNASGQSTVAGVLGPDVAIGTGVTIDSTSRIRKRSVIGNGVTVGQNVRIARDVTVEYDVTIGDNVTIRTGAVIGHGATLNDGETVGRDQTIDSVASGLAVVAQRTSTSAPFQTVYQLEAQTVPVSGDLRVWYQTTCEAAGLRPVMCDYNNWGATYDARAWNAVILERGYWSCNVSSGIGARGLRNLITFHRPNNDVNGIYATGGAASPGSTSSVACTD
jgi:NDP-sugar pyrophosphorylase family protein